MLEGNTGITGNDKNVLLSTYLLTLNSGSLKGGKSSLALIEAVFESRPPLKVKCLGMGKRVEIFNLVFPGTLFALGYFRVSWVFPGISGI